MLMPQTISVVMSGTGMLGFITIFLKYFSVKRDMERALERHVADFKELKERVRELEKTTVTKIQLNEILDLHFDPINKQLERISRFIAKFCGEELI